MAGETRLPLGLVRTLLALLTCFAAVFVSAAEPPPADNANRFLFIVDTSASMKLFENAVRETVFDLVYSGVRGQMTNGDTYGIWLVNDQNDTSFTMESWKQRYNVELGARVSVHVKDHGYKGKARLDVAIADAMRIVKNVGDLTIVLVSNGETPIAGTPFDAGINARFAELAPQMKKAKLTLNTVLVAQDGAIVAWAANSPEYLIDVPQVAPKLKRVKKEIAAAKTNAPAAVVSNAVARSVPINVAPPKPRVASNPIIITKDTVAQEKRSYQALTMTAMTNEPTPAAVLTNLAAAQVPVAATNAEPAPATVTNVIESKPVIAVTNATVRSSNAVVATTTVRTETNAVMAMTKKELTNVTAAAIAKPSAPVEAAASQPLADARSIHPALWVALGAAAASLGVLATFLVFRSRRRQPSLISQSLVRERIGSIIS